MTLQALANNTLIILRDVNNYAQSVPYAGRVWTFARDQAVFPAAALLMTIWAAVQPKLAQIFASIAANPGIAALGAITLILIASLLIPGPAKQNPSNKLLEEKLTAAERKIEAQKKIISKLRQAAAQTALLPHLPPAKPAAAPLLPPSVLSLQDRFIEAGKLVDAQKKIIASLEAAHQPIEEARTVLKQLLEAQLAIGEELKAEYQKNGIK